MVYVVTAVLRARVPAAGSGAVQSQPPRREGGEEDVTRQYGTAA